MHTETLERAKIIGPQKRDHQVFIPVLGNSHINLQCEEFLMSRERWNTLKESEN